MNHKLFFAWAFCTALFVAFSYHLFNNKNTPINPTPTNTSAIIPSNPTPTNASPTPTNTSPINPSQTLIPTPTNTSPTNPTPTPTNPSPSLIPIPIPTNPSPINPSPIPTNPIPTPTNPSPINPSSIPIPSPTPTNTSPIPMNPTPTNPSATPTPSPYPSNKIANNDIIMDTSLVARENNNKPPQILFGNSVYKNLSYCLSDSDEIGAIQWYVTKSKGFAAYVTFITTIKSAQSSGAMWFGVWEQEYSASDSVQGVKSDRSPLGGFRVIIRDDDNTVNVCTNGKTIASFPSPLASSGTHSYDLHLIYDGAKLTIQLFEYYDRMWSRSLDISNVQIPVNSLMSVGAYGNGAEHSVIYVSYNAQ
jgi:hypothetical protein